MRFKDGDQISLTLTFRRNGSDTQMKSQFDLLETTKGVGLEEALQRQVAEMLYTLINLPIDN